MKRLLAARFALLRRPDRLRRPGRPPSARRAAGLAAPPWLCLGLLLGLLTGCEVNPVTGERELALISEEQEIAMGREAAGQVEQTLGLVQNPELQAYVEGIGLELARDSERPDLPWAFGVVDDPTPNAFALPGGFIFITRGMINLMDSEAELASVLGHEIGHVTARHSVNQMSRAQIAQLGLGLGMILAPELQQFGNLAGAGMNLLFLQYGREDERQSDELGFRYIREHNYAVEEMADVFAALQRAGELQGQSALPTWLSSHPSPPERIEAVNERAAALETPQTDARVGRADFLRQLEGVTYGENPRNGFFRGSAFYHPELGFAFTVPEGWQKQNLNHMVVASGENAALQLTIAPTDSIEEAARRFFGADGIRALDSRERRLDGGGRAIVSTFEAEGQSGTVRGHVSHIAHGSAVYELVGFAPAQSFAQQANALERLVTSFEPVRDQEILDVSARQVEIVELAQAMSLAQFDEMYPSSIPIEQLALINQVEGPESRLEAGALVKRVVGG